jgi:hypothetical protein
MASDIAPFLRHGLFLAVMCFTASLLLMRLPSGASLRPSGSVGTAEPLLQLRTDLSVAPAAFRALQMTVDCWLSAAGAGGSVAAAALAGSGGAWVDASPSTGWMYPAGLYGGAHATGSDSWRWAPAPTCGAGWLAWDAARAARVLSRFGGVFFLGDSLAQQMFESMLSAFPNGVPVPFDFVQDDRAQWSTSAFAQYEEGGFGFVQNAWSQFFPEGGGTFRVLVINRGAHFVPNATFVTELNETLYSLRTQRPDVLVIWRASVAGAAECDTFAGEPPLNNFSRLPPRERWPYKWDEIQDQNALARALIREHYPQILIIDPVAPSMLRPSSRLSATPPRRDNEDCIHWAMPGPPDMWNVALIEALAILSTLAVNASTCCPAHLLRPCDATC